MTPPTISVFQTTAELSEALGLALERLSLNRPKFNVALSGGSLPALLGASLPPSLTGQGWCLFFADERCVPHSSPDSNLSLVKAQVLSKLPLASVFAISEALVHSPDLAAAAYQRDLKSVFGEVALPEFDLILLGMGPDGKHIILCLLVSGVFLLGSSLIRVQNRTHMLFIPLPSPPPAHLSYTLGRKLNRLS